MKLNRLSGIITDYFSVDTGEPVSLVEFTRHIGSHAVFFDMLSSNGERKKPQYEVLGSRISIIRLDDILIEIEQIGCTQEPEQLPPLSTNFLVNTRDTVKPARWAFFRDYLDHTRYSDRTNGHYK
jgi:hypothetical protein